ncbi:MAG: site-specific integrase [Oscillospiraceae bacterium]|nr:site-specific integrase [Oscillospiraceae bacterium]
MPKQAFQCQYIESKDIYRKQVKKLGGGYTSLYDRDKKKLERKYKEYMWLYEEGVAIHDNMTVAEYAQRWYKLNTAELSAARCFDLRNAINKHICPHIGDKKMKNVTPDDVCAILVGMKDMSQSSQIKVVSTLKRIFGAAEENRIIQRSPCNTLKAKGYKAKEKTPLTAEQSQVLLNAVEGTSAHLFIMLGLYTGMRREEILGLKWDCVHFGFTPHIQVRRTLIFEDNVRPVLSDKLKSNAAKRDIPIPPVLVDYLLNIERSSDFVICNRDGKMYTYTAFKNMWANVTRRMLKEGESQSVTSHGVERSIDFKVTPHILRHTYITNLIMAGVNIKKVQYLAGHAKVDITLNIYSHVVDNTPASLMGDVMSAFN